MAVQQFNSSFSFSTNDMDMLSLQEVTREGDTKVLKRVDSFNSR